VLALRPWSPAVGIPAVVARSTPHGASNGDRIRVNGVTGTVEVLERAAGGWSRPGSLAAKAA
jgi:hypothetical protein